MTDPLLILISRKHIWERAPIPSARCQANPAPQNRSKLAFAGLDSGKRFPELRHSRTQETRKFQVGNGTLIIMEASSWKHHHAAPLDHRASRHRRHFDRRSRLATSPLLKS
jgi:hypothetical protein